MPKIEKENKKLTVDSRPKLKKNDAISIRLPGEDQDESDDSWSFNMSYVTPSGQLVHRSCTRKIWQEINEEALFKKFRYDFEVYEDENEVVHHINAKLKREFLPAGFSAEDIENESRSVDEVRFLEITKDASDTLRVMRAPSSCSRPTEDEIVDSLSKDDNVSSGTYILGKYRVDEIREREGVLTYYIDTNFKQ